MTNWLWERCELTKFKTEIKFGLELIFKFKFKLKCDFELKFK